MKRKRKKQKHNGKLTLGKKNVRDLFFMALSITSNLLLASSSNPDFFSQNSQHPPPSFSRSPTLSQNISLFWCLPFPKTSLPVPSISRFLLKISLLNGQKNHLFSPLRLTLSPPPNGTSPILCQKTATKSTLGPLSVFTQSP